MNELQFVNFEKWTTGIWQIDNFSTRKLAMNNYKYEEHYIKYVNVQQKKNQKYQFTHKYLGTTGVVAAYWIEHTILSQCIHIILF